MAEPPVVPAVNATLNWPLLGLIVPIVGAPGAVAAVTVNINSPLEIDKAPVAPEAKPEPAIVSVPIVPLTPVAPAVNATLNWPSVGVIEVIVGAAGVVAGVAAVLPVAVPSPIVFTAFI